MRARLRTTGLLMVGYVGYYVCRSNFSVAGPYLIDDLVAGGATREAAKDGLGWITSAGMVAYAVGKLAGGGMADLLGGRRTFLVGMVGSIGCTIGFALGGSPPAFGLAWSGNRLFQSWGWPGLVKVASRWYPHVIHGSAMAILSLSYLFGDVLARLVLTRLFAAGLDWRRVFAVASAALAALLILNATFLRESPSVVGLPEPEPAPDNVFGREGADASPPRLRTIAGPLFRSPAFWLVCGLSAGLTLIRETFNFWTPTYLTEGVGLDKATAGATSVLFPLAGGVSVLAAGYLNDRLGRVGRASVILAGLVLGGSLLAVLGRADLGGSRWSPIGLVTAIAFLVVGPYSYLAGAIALDLGGKRGAATASALIDVWGYLGGIMAGIGAARINAAFGWSGVFLALAGVAAASSVAAAAFLAQQVLSVRR